MLKQCQHKLAFSKSNWYSCAIRAIVSNNEKRVIGPSLKRYQCRPTATLVSALRPNSDIPSTTFMTPPPAPLQPLQALKVPNTNEKFSVITSSENYRRCAGFRRYDGQRCERLVQINPSLPITDPVLCFNHNPNRVKKSKSKGKRKLKAVECNHKKEVSADHQQTAVKEKKIFNAPAKVYDCWNLWIGKHINEEESNLIRQEMEKPISNRDKPGFIYAYSLSQGPRVSRNTYAYFKIGRTTNPHRRMYQVSNVCKMEPEIIELFPSFPKSSSGSKNRHILPSNLQALENTLDEIPKCPLSHRVERLIHLELFSTYTRAGFKCHECGTTHREWIRVNRTKNDNGSFMTDHELWLSSIRPVILKWVQYGVVASAVNKSNNVVLK